MRIVVSFLIVGLFAGTAASAQSDGARKGGPSGPPMTRQITIVSSAGARALADACTAWAEKNKLVLAMAIIDWGGNVLESHAMEGAAANAIETALLKARSAAKDATT